MQGPARLPVELDEPAVALIGAVVLGVLALAVGFTRGQARVTAAAVAIGASLAIAGAGGRYLISDRPYREAWAEDCASRQASCGLGADAAQVFAGMNAAEERGSLSFEASRGPGVLLTVAAGLLGMAGGTLALVGAVRGGGSAATVDPEEEG